MAMDERIVRRLVGALLLLHVIGYIPSVKCHCIWYGVCRKEFEFNNINCAYKGPAKPVQEETKYILDKYCPQLASGPVCCDNEQLNNLKINIALAENILARCPSCMDNFMQHICGMTCSPNQSDFIKPVSIKKFNSTHRRVMEIDYHLSDTYKEATFSSCQEIAIPENPEINGTALDLMCGDYGAANCTADRWFQFLGDTTNPFVPFQINFVGGDGPSDGYIPYNPPTKQTGFHEQGCKEIKPTTKEDANDDSATENNSTIPNKAQNLTQFKKTEKNLDKTGSCTFNCELFYRQQQKKLEIEEDYYSFKKDYLRQKLVMLREQTDAFKTISRKMAWQH